jgi:hypothetical protein
MTRIQAGTGGPEAVDPELIHRPGENRLQTPEPAQADPDHCAREGASLASRKEESTAVPRSPPQSAGSRASWNVRESSGASVRSLMP